MNTLIYICGVYSLLFAIFHMMFWKLFGWETELKKLSFVNRGITQIMNLRLIYYFLFVAIVCFLFPEELYETVLGKVFLAGASLFWLGRTIEQFIFFRVNSLKVQAFTLIFIVGTILFALPLFL